MKNERERGTRLNAQNNAKFITITQAEQMSVTQVNWYVSQDMMVLSHHVKFHENRMKN